VGGLYAGTVVVDNGSTFGRILLASLAAGAANFAVDVAISSSTLLIRRSGGSPLSVLRAVGPLNLVSLPLYVPLVALLAYVHDTYSTWVVATFFLPAVALQRLIHLYQQQRDATANLAAANVRLEEANLSFAAALIATLDARDRYTAGHSAAVAIYSRDIAVRMGLSTAQQNLAHLAGLVHDIGKVGLPPGLLEKDGPLSLDERRVMETHSVIGERILANVADYSEVAAIVRHHHERVDGNGYPDRLTDEAIPIISRIIGVADAYNAMTSDRPYRDAMPSRVARMRLAQAVETQFDTAVVAAFEAILTGADESYRLASSAEFTIVAREAYEVSVDASVAA
jgi:putative nucleotidyltransferase with HDIG domain